MNSVLVSRVGFTSGKLAIQNGFVSGNSNRLPPVIPYPTHTDKMLSYLDPPGANVYGTRMNAYWRNYLFTAERYIHDCDSFRFVSYEQQQKQNEDAISEECSKLGVGEEYLNVSRQFYNAQVVLYKKESTNLTYEFACSLKEQYDIELAQQNEAAKLIQQLFKSRLPTDIGTLIAEEEYYGKCAHCFEPRMGHFTTLCADCYWDEDAAYKRNRRLVRQYTLPAL